MVCVAKDLRCECIVRDSIKNFEKYEVTFPASTSVYEFITHVAEKMNHESHTFQLTMQVCGSDEKVFTVDTEGSLQSAGLSTEPGARNSLILEGRRGAIDKTAEIKSPTNLEDSALTSPPPPPDQFPSYQLRTLRPPTASPAAEYTFSTPLIRHETGYVGLVNPAMTCYLNSLLQALYMTPEFRNALYKWQFDASHISNSSKCIPFQLQKLFLNLQTSTKTAVETTELIRSFGWESGEVWQQHDIQELCRVMFDALEQEFKDTEQADLINQLYQGKMIDYVKCLECDTEKSREDTFLDIPLPVRPFGSTVAYGSVEEALTAFVQPETLDGNNQYLCEVCKKKCNAHKGLKFTKFPYLLTLHLKRFDFDYSTLHRIKLNDKLIFPDVLNLNSFINNNKQLAENENEVTQDSIVKGDDSSITDSVLDEDTNLTMESHNNEIDQDEDEGIDLSSNSGNNHENEKNLLQNMGPTGPFMYELYSIMIHSGSASGGHYYAYIKDFSKKEWFCFNDQSVTSITYEDIKKTYGGSGGSARGYYSGAYSSSTNAYMLMYRQINKESNCYSMTQEEFPPHIQKLLEELKEAEERERALKARLGDMVRIRVHANHPMLMHPLSNKISCHNDSTMEEVKSMAYSYLKLEGIVPEEQCRLVIYNKAQEEMEESLENREKETVSEVFANSKSSNNIEFLLEIRDKNKKFLPYNIGDIKLSVYIYGIDNHIVEGPHEIRTSPCQNLSDLKKLLQDYIPLKSDDIHVVLVKADLLEYIDDDLPLNKLGFSSPLNRVFVCYKGQEGDLSTNFQTSELYKCLKEVKNVITMEMNLPDIRKETLDILLIPPLVLSKTGSEEKTSDSTPTGDSVPLTNGLQEEEVGYSSTGGGTSDQSASEDSSLTDSDRTIIGETFECTISTPCDSEQQLSSIDKSNQINGEIDKWDLENDEPVQNYYFHASPCIAEDGKKMLKVIVDRSIGTPMLKKKLEKFIGVASKYIKLVKGAQDHEISCSLRNCKDYERINVKLERVLNEGEHKIRVHILQPNGRSPSASLFDYIVSNGDSIKSIKKALVKEVEKRALFKIPFERCRLRRQNFKNPGAVLLDTEVWDETFRVSHQIEVYLQELTGPDPVTDSSQVLLFVRRWHPSELTLGPFEEIVLDSQSSTSLGKKLIEISDIPSAHLEYARGKLPFPGETSVQNLTDLNWESFESDSKGVLSDWGKDDGSIIFYRNELEELKTFSKDLVNDRIVQETNNTASTNSSYISNYSPRRERALKIYLDTTSRRTRSAVDID